MDDCTVRTSSYILHFSGLFLLKQWGKDFTVKSNESQKDVRSPAAYFALKSAILIRNFKFLGVFLRRVVLYNKSLYNMLLDIRSFPVKLAKVRFWNNIHVIESNIIIESNISIEIIVWIILDTRFDPMRFCYWNKLVIASES